MTAFTTYTDGAVVAKGSGGNYAGSPVRTVLTGYFDATRRNMTAADTMAVLSIPAGTWVEAVVLEVITAEATATPTISVGDAATPTGWVSGQATNVPGKFLGASTGYAMISSTGQANGKLYTVADTLNLLIPTGDAATTLVCKVHAICTIV